MFSYNHGDEGAKTKLGKWSKLERAAFAARNDPAFGHDDRVTRALNYCRKGTMRALLEESALTQQWTSIHSNRDIYFQHLQNCCTKLPSGLLLSLAEIATNKDTTREIYQLEEDEICFRWLCFRDTETKWQLHLRNCCTGCWHEWIELRRSERGSNKMTVHALRPFEEGTPLGFYLGKIVWRDSDCRADLPRPETLLREAPKRKDSSRQVLIRDKNYRICLIDPNPTNYKALSSPKSNLCYKHMGFHHVNDYLQEWSEGLVKPSYFERNTNVVLMEDGLLVASRFICTGESLHFVLE